MFQAKLCMPCIGTSIIRRKKIEDKLRLLPDYKFIYLSAPAGYGKTTAVAYYLTRENIRHAWFSIDESDNDPVIFWRYFTAAVSRCAEDGGVTDISIDAKLVASNISADFLIQILENIQEELIIVLDDYHLIENSTILGNMEYFIRFMPSNIKLIFLSRKEPENYLSVLCSRGAAIRLGTEDIAFDPEETAEFFSQKELGLTAEELKIMDGCTEGWAAGLVAASFSIRTSGDRNQAIRTFSGRNRDVSAIFEFELFRYWPEEMQAFLIHTSFLERLNGSLCRAVTGYKNSSELLKRLAESNSFILPLDREYDCYRYHHLFQKFLSDRFELEQEESKRTYYCRAGEWYLAHGQVAGGINWLLKAGEYEKAYPFISDYRNGTVADSNYSLWKKWIDQIPEKLYEKDPAIYVSYSWVSSMEGKTDAARVWADKASDSFEMIKSSLGEPERDALEAYVIFSKLNVAIFLMDVDRIFLAYDRLSELKLKEPVAVGELNWDEPNLLKTAYGFMGRLSMLERCLPFYYSLPGFIGGFSSYAALSAAEFYYERNRLNELEHMLLRHMAKIIGMKIPSVVVPCSYVISKAKMAKGDVAGAFETVREAKKLLNAGPGNIWQYYTDILLAQLYLRIGDTDNALKLIDTEKIGPYDDLSGIRELEYTVYVRILLRQNRLPDALILLNRLEEFARWEDRLSSRVEILCLTAIAYGMTGNYSEAMRSLETALTIGAEEGYVRTFVDEMEPMAELLNRYQVVSRSDNALKHAACAKKLFRLTNEYSRIMQSALRRNGGSLPSGVFTASLLSPREQQILRLLAESKSNAAIAEELRVSLSTVKQHNSKIFDKLGVKNRQEAVARAMTLGILK